MSIKDVMFSKDEAEYAPLGLWAERLEIPVPTLLYHAAHGAFPVFFVPNLHAQELRYVDTTEIDPQHYDVADPPPLPESSIHKSIHESIRRPGKLVGICLDHAICERLAKGKEIHMPFFAEAMWWDERGLKHIGSEEKVFGLTLPPRARFAIFPDKAHADYVLGPDGPRLPISRWLPQKDWERPLEEHIRTPVSTLIQPHTVCARDVDVSNFVRGLVDYRFIADLFDGKTISKDLPPYLSEKLLELINAHRTFWSEVEDLDSASRNGRKAQLTTRLRRAFKNLCREQSNTNRLAQYGATVCHPFSESDERLLEKTLVTPLMLALLTASKLYWAPHRSDSGAYETRPPSTGIIHFLQHLGLRKLNEGRAAATLIEPEVAWESEPDELNTQPIVSWPTTPGTLRPTLGRVELTNQTRNQS